MQDWGSLERDPRQTTGIRFGDAAYASVSFSSLASTLAARNFDNKDRTSRRQQKLLQGVFDQGTGVCRKCGENEDKLRDVKKKSLLEIEHLRQALKKCTDQLCGFMSANAYATFYQSLQLDVRFMSKDEDDEAEKGRSPTDSAMQSPKMASVAEVNRLKQEILRLEDEIARLELKNTSLEEELKRADPTRGGRRTSTAPQTPKPDARPEGGDDALRKRIRELQDELQRAKDETEKLKKANPYGGRGGDDDGEIDPITGKRLPPGAKKFGAGGSDDDLRAKLRELEAALERAKDEADLAQMKLRKAEREHKEEAKAAQEKKEKTAKAGADHSKELEELRKKIKALEAVQQKLIEASGLTPEELEKIQNAVAAELGMDIGGTGSMFKGSGKTGQKGGATAGGNGKKGDGTQDGEEDSDDDGDPTRPGKKGGSGKKGKKGAGGKYGGGPHGNGPGGRNIPPGGRIGPNGEILDASGRPVDEFGNPIVETAEIGVGPGPGYPQDQEMPALLKGSAPKLKPEEPLSKFKTCSSKQLRAQPSLSMMGDASGSLGASHSIARSKTTMLGTRASVLDSTQSQSEALGATRRTLASTQNQTQALEATRPRLGSTQSHGSTQSKTEKLGATQPSSRGSSQQQTEVLVATQPMLGSTTEALEQQELQQPLLQTTVTINPEVETIANSAQSRELDGTSAELQQRLVGAETPSTKAASQQRIARKSEVGTKGKAEAGRSQSASALASTAPSPQVAANATWSGEGAMHFTASATHPGLVHSSSSPLVGANTKPKKAGGGPHGATQAEPYILNIWEQYPHGKQTPEQMKLELISLGAVSPRTASKQGKGSGKGTLDSAARKTRPIVDH